MRILNEAEFLKEPFGTVYAYFKPRAYVSELKIKDGYRSENSWWATDIMPWVNDEEFDKHNDYAGNEYLSEEFCTDDAFYDHDKDTLYAVFDKQEVKDMIDRLSRTQ